MNDHRHWANDNSRQEKKGEALDERLAAFTDALIKGEAPPIDSNDADLEEMKEVVKRLHDTIEPRKPADPALRKHVAHRLEMEWNLIHHRNVHNNRRTHMLPPLKLAAGLSMVLLASLLFLLILEGDKIPFLQGSAVPPSSEGVVVALAAAVIALLAAAVYAIWRRQK